jgi:hypothetical protein
MFPGDLKPSQEPLCQKKTTQIYMKLFRHGTKLSMKLWSQWSRVELQQGKLILHVFI